MSKTRAAIRFRRLALWCERRGVGATFASSSTESSDDIVIAKPTPLLAFLVLRRRPSVNVHSASAEAVTSVTSRQWKE